MLSYSIFKIKISIEFYICRTVRGMDSILNYKRCDDDDYYSLLRCDPSSSTEQILAEYKALSLQYHPDKNPDNPTAVETFQKIQKAKELLTDPEKRGLYDKWRQCCFCIPFEQFLNLNKSAHTSIHWACKKQKDLMIESSCVGNQPCQFQQDHDTSSREKMCHSAAWERDPAKEVLRKFRNYEI